MPVRLPVRVTLVAAVLAAGSLFRFSGLADKVLWHDEVYTLLFAAGYQSRDWGAALPNGRVVPVAEVQRFFRPNPDKGLADTLRGLSVDEPQHPPLYYLLARLWAGVCGDGIARLRLLSALLSLFAFPALYWLCRELFAATRVAWVSLLLFSVSPFHVLYAQEAREYALWTVLILASSAALVRALRVSAASAGVDRAVAAAWALYALAVTVSLYTSFSTVAVVAAHGTFVLARERLRPTRSLAGVAAAWAAAATLFAPWALLLAHNFDSFRVSMAWSTEIVIPRLELLGLFFLNLSRQVLDLWPEADTWPARIAVALVALLATVALVELRRLSPPTRLLILALVTVPLVMLILPDLFLGGIRSVSARYLTPTWIGVTLALAALLGDERPGPRWRSAVLGLVLVAGLASGSLDTGRESVWSKGVSRRLPDVAAAIHVTTAPLVVSNRDHHNPGNLLALAARLPPGASVQLVESEVGYRLPDGFDDLFLLSPTDQFRHALEARDGVRTEPVVVDVLLSLWRVRRPGRD